MDKQYTRACVTGGAGFIGSYLTRALLARGMEVCILDNFSTGRKSNVPAGVSVVHGDILCPEEVDRALSGCDIVFHLAARVAIRSSFEFVVEDTRNNVCGTASVMRGVQQAGSVRKVVAASSMAVYCERPEQTPIPECYPTEAISPYGISKLAAEKLTHAMCAAAGVPSVVLRLFNTYGSGQALSPYVGVVTIFVNALHSGKTPIIFGDGEQCRDFVHVQDVVAGFLAAMDADVSGETFNIGSGRARSVNAVMCAIQRAMSVHVPSQYHPSVPGELRYSVADITRSRARLGYQPQHDFDDLIGELVKEILRSNPDVDSNQQSA
jgi:UDP-glucose 4-epimerase